MESQKLVERKITYRESKEKEEGCAKCKITKLNTEYVKKIVYRGLCEERKIPLKCRICKKETITSLVGERKKILLNELRNKIEPRTTDVTEIIIEKKFKIRENNEEMEDEKDQQIPEIIKKLEQDELEMKEIEEKEEMDYQIDQILQQMRQSDMEKEQNSMITGENSLNTEAVLMQNETIQNPMDPLLSTNFSNDEMIDELFEAVMALESEMTLTNEKPETSKNYELPIQLDETDIPHMMRDYRREKVRRESFRNWPLSGISTEKLAAAGFYFTGETDIVTCYACQLSLTGWSETDEPIERHRTWNRSCPVISGLRSDNIPIEEEYKNSGSSMPTDECGLYLQQQTAVSEIPPIKRCKICFLREIEVIFLPCGHLVCCKICSEILINCAVCTIRIEKQHKVYFV